MAVQVAQMEGVDRGRAGQVRRGLNHFLMEGGFVRRRLGLWVGGGAGALAGVRGLGWIPGNAGGISRAAGGYWAGMGMRNRVGVFNSALVVV